MRILQLTTLWFWIFCTLQVADMATTLVGLRYGGVEANGFVAFWFKLVGPLPGLLLVKAIALLVVAWVYAHRDHNRYFRYVYCHGSVIFTGVVAWNCSQLAKVI